jgi:predicted O-methyltransferase YrrM
VAAARERAHELGAPPISLGSAAALSLLAAAVGARAVVEVGTGAGVSGAWLLAGMHDDGILTSIDVEAEHQRVARETFHSLGVGHARSRLITGRALEVMPRLTDGAYDLVFIDGDKTEYPALLEQALRLLRPGGIVVFDNVLWSDRAADPAHRDAETLALREVAALVREDPRLVAALLPVGDGLLAAVLRDPDAETA